MSNSLDMVVWLIWVIIPPTSHHGGADVGGTKELRDHRAALCLDWVVIT